MGAFGWRQMKWCRGEAQQTQCAWKNNYYQNNMEKEVKETKGQTWRKRLKQVGGHMERWMKEQSRRWGGEIGGGGGQRALQKSQWVIVLGSCAWGRVVKMREKRKDREAQQGNKKSSFPSTYSSQDFQCGSMCLWGFLSHVQDTQKHKASQWLGAEAPPPSSLHPTSSHSTKTKQVLSPEQPNVNPPSSALHSPALAHYGKKKSSLDSRADREGS